MQVNNITKVLQKVLHFVFNAECDSSHGRSYKSLLGMKTANMVKKINTAHRLTNCIFKFIYNIYIFRRLKNYLIYDHTCNSAKQKLSGNKEYFSKIYCRFNGTICISVQALKLPSLI